MQVAVDASVAVKWFLPEIHDDAALRLIESGADLSAPSLLHAEAANVLWKRVRRGEMSREEAQTCLASLTRLPLHILPMEPLLPAALEIACETGQTVYDGLYVAVACARHCKMVTADERLLKALSPTPLSKHIMWIGNIA